MKKTLTILAIIFTSIAAWSQCPTEIVVNTESGCGLYALHLNNFGSSGNIIWTYDEGLPLSTGSNNVSWGADSPGMHEICAQAWNAECPNGVTICTQIEVPMCPAFACPSSLIASATDNCHEWNFEIVGSVEGETVIWYFDANTEGVIGTHSISHTFTENGNHTVCAYYIGSNCLQGTELCTTVEVSCASTSNCPESISVIPTNNCHLFYFEINAKQEVLF